MFSLMYVFLILAFYSCTFSSIHNYPKILSYSGRGDISELRKLLDDGADANFVYNSYTTALIEASKDGHIDTVNLLVDRGANINYMNKWGDTALRSACRNNHGDIVKLLLDKGAYKIDEKYRNIYLQAVNMPNMQNQRRLEYQEVIQKRLEILGFKVTREDTPYIDQAYEPSEKAHSILEPVSIGRKWEYQFPEPRPTKDIWVLYEVIPYSYTTSLSKYNGKRLSPVIKYDVNTLKLLVSLIDLRNEEIIASLSSKYENPPSISSRGSIVTLKPKAPLTLNTLIGPNIDDIRMPLCNLYTRLGIGQILAHDFRNASKNGEMKILKDLIVFCRKGMNSSIFDINATDDDGRTALMLAAENGHSKAVSLLISEGADIYITDNQNETALDKAKREKRSYVIKVFERSI